MNETELRKLTVSQLRLLLNSAHGIYGQVRIKNGDAELIYKILKENENIECPTCDGTGLVEKDDGGDEFEYKDLGEI